MLIPPFDDKPLDNKSFDNKSFDDKALNGKVDDPANAPLPKVRVRAGFLIGVLATTVILMNLFFVSIAFYLGVDLVPEESTSSASSIGAIEAAAPPVPRAAK